MKLYAIHTEGCDDQVQVMYFTDRDVALENLVRTLLEQDFQKVICMYCWVQEDTLRPMVLKECIQAAWDPFSGYRMKRTMKKHGITKEMAIGNPRSLYADLVAVANDGVESDVV